jgi:hypothetical protein
MPEDKSLKSNETESASIQNRSKKIRHGLIQDRGREKLKKTPLVLSTIIPTGSKTPNLSHERQ